MDLNNIINQLETQINIQQNNVKLYNNIDVGDIVDSEE